MKKLICIVALVVMAHGCTAIVTSPEETVATYNLFNDQLEALLIKECVDLHGANGCTPYPNEMECQTLKIQVKADGRTWVDCQANGKVVKQGYANLADGVPIMCKTNSDMSCQTCLDVFGNTILDNCNRNAQSFRSSQTGWGPGNSAGFLVEPGDNANGTPGTPTTPPNTTPGEPTPANPPMTPPSGGDDKCNPSNAVLKYAQELNKILNHEGLNFSWTPDLSKMADPTKGFFGNGNNQGNISCHAFTAAIKSKLHKCAVTKGGECYYCWNDLFSSKKTCRCYRINVAAMKAACGQIPTDCDHNAWSGAMIQAYGISNQWLFSPSYSNFYGQVTPPAGDAPKFPKCQGSPLVLDLEGDGIEPTAPASGVRFDLMGFGALQTAWVKGDDALLALDRDGNGRIDSGAELFGEATGGLPHEDGFQALAALDDNSDGKVDAADKLYRKLVLWQDRNADGVSQKSEMRTLRQAGIKSLGLGSSVRSGAIDKHGNDMHLQGGFTRADGSAGLMVDVFFVVK